MAFSGRSIIVTGASSGIGRATALALGQAHGSIVAVGRQAGALAEVVAAVERAGGRACAVEADVTAADAPARIVGAALEAFGGIDVLVNAAGIIASGTIETTTDQAWDVMMDINVRAPFRLMSAAAPHLVARKGAVVIVSSVTGLR
jgi:meso-butanediol dehydrogenase / (S,S)-butanediol dehydrogenase / diacetyl reductase